MEEEIRRQEEEKKEIENRLREKIKRQEKDEEEKKEQLQKQAAAQEQDPRAAAQSEMYNDAPTYYLPTIIPQNALSPENQQLYDEFVAKLINPFTPLEELKDMYMKPVPPRIG